MGPNNELPQAPSGPPQRAPPGSLWAHNNELPQAPCGPHNEIPQAPSGHPQRAPQGSLWAPTTSSPRLLVRAHHVAKKKKPSRARRFTGRLRGAPRPARSPRTLFAGADLKGFGGSPASALQHGFLHMLSCISFQTFKIGMGRK